MSKLQNLNAQIEKAQAEIQQKENRVKELVSKQKAEEKKVRNHRLCKRHGMFESLLPEIIEVTDEQYKTFLERAVTNGYGRDILAKIIAQEVEATSTKTTDTTAQSTGSGISKVSTGAANNGTAPTTTQETPNDQHGKTTAHKSTETTDHNATPANYKPTTATPQANANPTIKTATANQNSNNAHNGNANGNTAEQG